MNNWLLDTNALLWLFEGSPRMDSVGKLFRLPDTRVHISVVSWWEIVIKIRAGKLPLNFEQFKLFVNEYDFIELPISNAYIKTYLELPNLHKDPFDHMLLAQAITCPMRLITGDPILAEYTSLVMVI